MYTVPVDDTQDKIPARPPDMDAPALSTSAQLAEEERWADAVERGDQEELRRIVDERRERARKAKIYIRLALGGSILAVLLAAAVMAFNLLYR